MTDAPATESNASPSAAPRPIAARPVHGAIQILQEKWVLLIVGALLEEPHGFNELGRAVGGCNPTTLAQRLHRLEEAGIVCKCDRLGDPLDPGGDGAGRSIYGLTDAGEALGPVVAAIGAWARDHLPRNRADGSDGRDGVAAR